MNNQIIFVDSSVQDHQSLIDGIDRAKIVILNDNCNAIEQITNVLASTQELSSIHIVSHGSDGTLFLGNSPLNKTTLETHAATVKQWGKALKANADILLYGCNVAQTEQGKAFVKRLSQLTKANVAASTTPTGNAKLGGNWNLEFIIGKIQAALAFSPAVTAAYSGILGDGPGGIGFTNGTSELQWWLRGDKGVTATTTVSSWADQSGVGLNATQAIAGSQPTFTTNAINGQPVVSFDGTTRNLQTPTLPATFATTSTSLFIVANTQTVNQSTVIGNSNPVSPNRYVVHLPWSDSNVYWDMGAIGAGGRLNPAWGGTTNTPYEWHFRSEQGVGQRIERNGTSIASDTTTSTFNPTGQSLYVNYPVGANFYNGSVAEVISYNRALNDAESTIVNNYLSAKYGLTNGNDKYVGDNVGSDYDFNVAGIGKEATGSNTNGNTTGGLIIDNGTFLQDNGDYLLAGQIETANATNVTTDLPPGVSSRSSRVWYLDKTDIGTAGGTVNLSFDFSDSGLTTTPINTAPYQLLYRNAITGTFTSLTTTTTISNTDQSVFNGIDTTTLLDGYYTIGEQNIAPTLDSSGAPTLTAILEDIATASNTGTLVSAIIASGASGNPITDPNTGAVQGIAVTGADTTNGSWQYSTDSGTTWNSFGALSDTSATLLNTTAKIRFIPTANYSGTITNGITFRAWDTTSGSNGGTGVNVSTNGNSTAFSTATETASIIVNPVNDIPSFTATNPVTVNQNPGAQTLTNWATFSPGGGTDETTQTATYTVSNIGTPGLFTTAPAVDAAGNLTYTPAATASGTSTFNVQVQDSGGTANGGVDTSTSLPFTITVNPAPTITNVSIPANKTYVAGENLDFTVTFNEAVTITGGANLPITLNTGGTVNATLNGNGASATTHNFRYSVVTGNLDTDGITLGTALSLPAASSTIQNANNANAILTFTNASTTGILIDAVAPNAPIFTTTSGTTNDSTPTLVGTAEPNSTVNILQGTTVVGTAIVDASGNWSFTPTTALVDGNYPFTATATDAAGNKSTPSTTVNLIVDATAPATPTFTTTSGTTNDST
ncbi:DUF4347 domain-containing protein, partial [Microcoleus sp. herbarium8]|uniref:DUF4347 domain-containing protein n=1 Tax=Microcoleus sp. herbarium8 TaxID=3055436 RepID=UPI002FCE6E3E